MAQEMRTIGVAHIMVSFALFMYSGTCTNKEGSSSLLTGEGVTLKTIEVPPHRIGYLHEAGEHASCTLFRFAQHWYGYFHSSPAAGLDTRWTSVHTICTTVLSFRQVLVFG